MKVNNITIDERKLPKVNIKNKNKDMEYHDKFYSYISYYDHTLNINYIKKAMSVKSELNKNKPSSFFLLYMQKTLTTYFSQFNDKELTQLMQ